MWFEFCVSTIVGSRWAAAPWNHQRSQKDLKGGNIYRAAVLFSTVC